MDVHAMGTNAAPHHHAPPGRGILGRSSCKSPAEATTTRASTHSSCGTTSSTDASKPSTRSEEKKATAPPETRRSSEPATNRRDSGGGGGGVDRRAVLAHLKRIRDADKDKAQAEARLLSEELMAKENEERKRKEKRRSSSDGNETAGGDDDEAAKSSSQVQLAMVAAAKNNVSISKETARLALERNRGRRRRSSNDHCDDDDNDNQENQENRRRSADLRRRPSTSAAAAAAAPRCSSMGHVNLRGPMVISCHRRQRQEDSSSGDPASHEDPAAAATASSAQTRNNKRNMLAEMRRLSSNGAQTNNNNGPSSSAVLAPVSSPRRRSVEHDAAATTTTRPRSALNYSTTARRWSAEDSTDNSPLPLEAVIDMPHPNSRGFSKPLKRRAKSNESALTAALERAELLEEEQARRQGRHREAGQTISPLSEKKCQDNNSIPSTHSYDKDDAADPAVANDFDRDLLVLVDLDRQASKLRQENAIYRDRCRTLRSERDASIARATELEGTLRAVREERDSFRNELRQALRQEGSSSNGADDADKQEGEDEDELKDAAALLRELRRARKEMDAQARRLREAEDEIERLSSALKQQQEEDEPEEEAQIEASSCDAHWDGHKCYQLKAMEQVLRAKDVALAAAREEAAELRAKVVCGTGGGDCGKDGGAGGGLVEAQRRERLKEMDAEAAAKAKKRMGAAA